MQGLNKRAYVAYSSAMVNASSILLAAAIMLQSLLGGIAAAGTICLGGGHEHPQDAISASCELDCSHATGRTQLPAPVAETHGNCGCVDLELNVSELLTTLPRLEAQLLPIAFLLPIPQATLSIADLGAGPCLSDVPSWFDPGGTQRIAHLSTTRLNV